MKEYDIKMIAMDLDGTVLSDYSEFTPENVSALREASKKGIYNVVATGRVYHSVPECVLTRPENPAADPNIHYLVCSNGARIFDLQHPFAPGAAKALRTEAVSDGSSYPCIYENLIAPEAIDRLCGLFSTLPYLLEIFTLGRAYISQIAYNNLEEYGLGMHHNEYVRRTRTPVADILEFLQNHRNTIENINVNFSSQDDKRRLIGLLSNEQSITVTSSFPTNIEIGGATTSKAEALSWLARRLGFGIENVMSFGDSPNDSAMIEAAGLGIAMGNADEEVKAVSDFVTLPNYEDGVAYAIRRFAL